MSTVESLSQLLTLPHQAGVTDLVYVRGSDAYYRHLNPGEAEVNGSTVLQAADGGVWSKRVESTGDGEGSGSVLSGTDIPTDDPGVENARYTRWNAGRTAIIGEYSWSDLTGTWIASLGAAIALLLCTLTGLAQSVKFHSLTTNALEAITSPLGLQILDAADVSEAQALLGLNVTNVGTITDGTVVTADLAASEQVKITASGVGWTSYTNTSYSALSVVMGAWDWTTYSTSPDKTTYHGFGCKFITNGLTPFNAVRIPVLTSSSTVAVDQIVVEVRAGVDTNTTAPSPILASGRLQLRNDVDDWTNVVVLLDATITPGAQADPLFVGYRAVNSSGTSVAIGATQAYPGNANVNALNRYFRYQSGAWSSYGSSQYFAVELVNVTGGSVSPAVALKSTASLETYARDSFQDGTMSMALAGVSTVSGTATALNTITNQSGVTGASTIFGWGYKFYPGALSGSSFNAIRIPWACRYTDPSRTKQRDRIWVQVRKATATGTSTPTELVANGISYVDPSMDALQDVVVLLRDPVTSELKTVSTNDLTSVSFVGAGALHSDNTGAHFQYPIGTDSAYAGNTFYTTQASYAPIQNGGWGNQGTAAVAYEFLSIATPAETVTGVIRRDALLTARGMKKPLAVPDYLYAAQGRVCDIYFDGMVDNYKRYDWDVTTSTAARGAHFNECWRFSPSDGTDYTIGFIAYDPYSGALCGTNSASLLVSASSEGGGVTVTNLFIGDSTGALPLSYLTTIDGTDANLNLAYIGTQGTSPKHEAYSGKGYVWMYSDALSPFTDTGGTFDFNYYLTNNSLATPTFVIINLGINDLSGIGGTGATGNTEADDATSLQTSRQIAALAEGMIASIHAVDSGIKIGIAVTTYPAWNQDASGDDYNADRNTWRARRTMWIHARNFISKFRGRTAERVYLVPIHLSLDTEHNMPLAASTTWNAHTDQTVSRQNNALHMEDSATGGARQIAEAYWAFLKQRTINP